MKEKLFVKKDIEIVEIIDGCEWTVTLYVAAEARELKLLTEGKWLSVPSPYSARLDNGEQPNQKIHIHGYEDGNEFFVVNIDGTSSHGYHGVTIPGKLSKALQKAVPGLSIRKDRLIEWLSPKTHPIVEYFVPRPDTMIKFADILDTKSVVDKILKG